MSDKKDSSEYVIINTEHYKFKIEVTNNIRDNKIISKYFLLGDKSQPCLSFILYTTDAQNILGKDIIYTAHLMNIERLKECIMNDVSDEIYETYSSNIELLNGFLKYIKKTYPYIKDLKLNDSTFIPCNKNDTLDLLTYYIALYGKTWYEDKYKAYSKDNYIRYKEQIKKYISKEFKSNISWELFYDMYIVLGSVFTKNIINNNIEICKEIFETSNTFPEFFTTINKKVKREYKCLFFKYWLEYFINEHIKFPREWYIPLQQYGGNLKDRQKRLQESLKEKDRVDKINTIIQSLGEHSKLIKTQFFPLSKFYYDSKKDVLYEITRDAELKLVSGDI